MRSFHGDGSLIVRLTTQAFDEHQKIVEALTKRNVAKVIDVMEDHIARTKHFQTRMSWPAGRLKRKDYKFREYSDIFRGRA